MLDSDRVTVPKRPRGPRGGVRVVRVVRVVEMARIIKRYGNRKLYDTSESRYVTLEEIARYVRDGEDVTVVENETGEDLTALAFAQIILEEERRKSGFLSLPVLRQLVQHGEEALQGIRAQVDRSMGAIGEIGERAGRRVQEIVGLRERLGDLQRRIDERVKRSLERITAHPTIQKELQRIERTIAVLEERINRLRGVEDGRGGNSRSDEPPRES
jgi:polyhydroxyalkanoate synthesis repressor PhaR